MKLKGGDYGTEGFTVLTLLANALTMTGNTESELWKGPQLRGELTHTGSRYWIYAIAMRHRKAPSPVDIACVHTASPAGARP